MFRLANLLRRSAPRYSGTDLLSLEHPDVARDPFPVYERLRAAGDVHFLPRDDAWIVLSFDAVETALRLPDVFSTSPYAHIDSVLLAAEPDAHAQVRRRVSRYFGPAKLAELEAYALDQARSLLRPRFDAVSELAEPLSAAVAGKLLGLDEAALAVIQRARAAPGPNLEARIRAVDDVVSTAAVFDDLQTDGFTQTQALSLSRLLWLAATSTTERAVAHAVFEMLRTGQRPGQSAVTPFVEEVLRLHPPELVVQRRTTQSVALARESIPAGALVYLCVAAANRDPQQFDDPAEFRPDRTRRRHLTFGGGIHQCIGAALGRSVTVAALRALLSDGRPISAGAALEGLVGWSALNAAPLERLPVELRA